MHNCERTQDLLEEYLDGGLEREQSELLELHLHSCAVCAAERELAVKVRGALRSLPSRRCPDVVSAAVLRQARSEMRRDWWQGLRAAWLRPVPLAAAALLALLGTGMLASGLLQRQPVAPSEQTEFTPAEIAQAEADLRLALAVVAKVHRRAGLTVRDDMRQHVVEPMRRVAEDAL